MQVTMITKEAQRSPREALENTALKDFVVDIVTCNNIKSKHRALLHFDRLFRLNFGDVFLWDG